MEMNQLDLRMSKLEREYQDLMYRQYQQTAQPPTSGVLSQDYMNGLY